MNTKLPASIQRLLWDADPSLLDQKVHQQLIIERVLNYGTLANWRWLIAHYGIHNVLATLKMRGTFSRSAIRNEARQLASLIIR